MVDTTRKKKTKDKGRIHGEYVEYSKNRVRYFPLGHFTKKITPNPKIPYSEKGVKSIEDYYKQLDREQKGKI